MTDCFLVPVRLFDFTACVNSDLHLRVTDSSGCSPTNWTTGFPLPYHQRDEGSGEAFMNSGSCNQFGRIRARLRKPALLGIFLSAFLPEHYLSADSKEVVKLGMALVSTMAALVLGLLIASTKKNARNAKCKSDRLLPQKSSFSTASWLIMVRKRRKRGRCCATRSFEFWIRCGRKTLGNPPKLGVSHPRGRKSCPTKYLIFRRRMRVSTFT